MVPTLRLATAAFLLLFMLSSAEAREPFGSVSVTRLPWTAHTLAVVAADMNRDGFSDIVIVNDTSIQVADGFSGGLRQPITISNHSFMTLKFVLNAAVADVNNDGFPDVIVAESTFVHVFLNTSSGMLAVGVSSIVSGGSARVQKIDVDGDSIPEFLFSSPTDVYNNYPYREVVKVIPNGQAITPFHDRMPTGSPTLLAGDFDGDGKLDIVGSGEYGDHSTYLYSAFLESDHPVRRQLPLPNDFRGERIAAPTRDLLLQDDKIYSIDGFFATAPHHHDVKILDVNGDGLEDVVPMVTMDILLQKSDGTFVQRPRLAVNNCGLIDFGDVNHDGALDAICDCYYALIVVWGLPDGFFDAGVVSPGLYPNANNTYRFTFVDLNGDGVVDEVSSSESEFAIRYGTKQGIFGDWEDLGTAPLSTQKFVAVRGRGQYSFAALSGPWHVGSLEKLRDGTLRSQFITLPLAADDLANSDVDGDGTDDIIASSASGHTAQVLLSRGSEFEFTSSLELPRSGTVTTGRFDRDRFADLFVFTPVVKSVLVMSGDGAGHFTTTDEVIVPIAPLSIHSADLDGDGTAEILVSGASGTVVMHKSEGTWFPAGDVGGPELTFDIGDVDGDGSPEIVSRAGDSFTSTMKITVYKWRDGRIAIDSSSILRNWDYVYLSDMNADGRADLIATDRFWSDVAVYLNGIPPSAHQRSRGVRRR